MRYCGAMDAVQHAQAESSTLSGRDRWNASRWKPGQSGNPLGRPKKLRITKLFEKILANPANRKELEESIKDILRSRRMAAVLMLREMAERTEGKVAEKLELDVNVNQYTDEEIAARLERLISAAQAGLTRICGEKEAHMPMLVLPVAPTLAAPTKTQSET